MDVDAPRDEQPAPQVRFPWFIAAGLGGGAVIAAGLILVLGATTVGWLTSPETDFGQAFTLASQVLLLAHGADVVIGGQLISIQPLGLSLVLILFGQPVAAFAARQAAAAEGDPDDTGALWLDPEPVLWRVVGVFVASWVAAIAALDLVTADGESLITVALAGAAMALIAGLWGSARELHYDPRDRWPGWLKAVPGAMALAVLTCVTGGAALLTIALFRHRDRIAAIHDGLQPELAGTVLLVIIQLFYLPNLILWATSWVLGGGITLGDGSLISIPITDVGFVPAIPVLGVVPEAGLGNPIWYWWLLVGVLAGIAAAFTVAWARPQARIDETTLVAGLAGVAAGGLVGLLASLASGGLGTERLAHMGARVGDLLIVAPSLMGLSGIVVGVIVGLVRSVPLWLAAWTDGDSTPAEPTDQEVTEEGR